MKSLYTLLMLAVAGAMAAQTGEFTTSKKGLIYSDEAIKELKHIVDSLNLKFKVCESKNFFSKLQGRALSFNLTGTEAEKALNDIKAGLDYISLMRKYPEAESKEELVVRYSYKNYNHKDEISYEPMSLNPDEGYSITFKGDEAETMKDKRKGWVYEYNDKDEYSDSTLRAYYFDKEIVSVPLKDEYARLVLYSECLIDTTGQVYYKDAKRSDSWSQGAGKKMHRFLEYVDKTLQKPKYEDFVTVTDEIPNVIGIDTILVDTTRVAMPIARLNSFHNTLDIWEAARLNRVDSLMQADKRCRELFEKALAEAIESPGNTTEEFEGYVAHLYSKKQALFLKRSRRVIGGCSMDRSPRYHALAIAELAGETASWEIFLRSHLDIMNDRFERVSDGSYALAARETYIKELEELDINVPDLLLGISLRVENPSENHYFGSISRIGRSLAEAKDRKDIETVILNMIKDDELDDYNRALLYWLFRNYNHNLTDEAEQAQNNQRLAQAVAFMPDYLAKRSDIKE